MSRRSVSLCVVLLVLAGCAQALPPERIATPSPPHTVNAPPTAAPPTAALPPASPAPPTPPPTAAPLPSPIPSSTEAEFASAVDAAKGEQAATGGVNAERMAAQLATSPFRASAVTQVGDDNALLTLFPELRTAPAPAWLAEGVRVTYYIQSAGPIAGPDEATSYGAGFIQYDLVAVQARSVRAAWKFYLNGSGGAITPSGAGVSRGIPGAGEYWVQPAVLQDAERVANDELAVVHMPTTISGRDYQAVRFDYRPAGATFVWVFDAASGILLFYRHTIGPEDNPGQTAQMILQARRKLNVPWRGGSAPAWAKGSTLEFEGEVRVLTFGSPTATFPLSVEAEPQGGTTRYVEYGVSQYTSGQLSNRTDRITGAGQLFDGFWLPPETLRTAMRRAVLDTDPVTGSRVTAAGAGGSVVLTESGPAYSTVLTYDSRTGALVSLEQETNAGAITTHTSLRLTD
jgi:hypothetical protein